MSGVEIPLHAIREQISSAVQIVVQQARLPDGSRRITEIAEVTGVESGKVLMQTLFRFQAGDGQGGRHTATGHIPQFLDSLGAGQRPDALALFGEPV
jgi:pilus assembly protein CpaF